MGEDFFCKLQSHLPLYRVPSPRSVIEIVCQSLQLEAEVSAGYVHPFGYDELGRRKVEDRADTCLDHCVDDLLGLSAGTVTIAIRTPSSLATWASSETGRIVIPSICLAKFARDRYQKERRSRY